MTPKEMTLLPISLGNRGVNSSKRDVKGLTFRLAKMPRSHGWKPEEAYQEALRRIAEAREQRLKELDLTGLLWDRIPLEVFEFEWLTVLRIGREWEWEYVEEKEEKEVIQHLPANFASLKSLQFLDFWIFPDITSAI